MDEEERCLFNADGLVKIGNEVVSIEEYQEQSMAIPDCCAWLRKTKHEFDHNDDPYLSNRKVVAKIKIRSYLIHSTLKAKIKHYKKIPNQGYKKRRANMRLSIFGIGFMPETCGPSLQVWSNFKNYKKRKTRKIHHRIWLLQREAIVCPENPFFNTHRCRLAFFLDDDSHPYGLVLQK